MAAPTVLEVYRREVTPELYRDVRELYKTHSIAEDARDLPGLISTLTPDCVYEIVQTGHRWEGHEGAARFYTELLTAFPDIRFDLTDIVIGPQGVCEEANVSATQQAPWLGVPPVECCRGTKPHHAANSRPFLHVVASPTAATNAIAGKGPPPSSCASR